MDETKRSNNLMKEDLQTFQAYMEMLRTQVAGQGSVQELVAFPPPSYSQPLQGTSMPSTSQQLGQPGYASPGSVIGSQPVHGSDFPFESSESSASPVKGFKHVKDDSVTYPGGIEALKTNDPNVIPYQRQTQENIQSLPNASRNLNERYPDNTSAITGNAGGPMSRDNFLGSLIGQESTGYNRTPENIRNNNIGYPDNLSDITGALQGLNLHPSQVSINFICKYICFISLIYLIK